MNLKGIIFVLLVSMQQTSFAEDRSDIWLELGAGAIGVNTDIKFSNDENIYAIGYSVYLAGLKNNEVYWFYAEPPRDRTTGKLKSKVFHELSAMKYWQFKPRFGYFDLGIGLGLARGETADNCNNRVTNEFSILSGGNSEVCDIETYITPSIPVEANAVLGHFFGLGLFGRASFSAEDIGVIVGMSIAIGKY